MSHPCWSLPHLLTSHVPQHAAPPGSRDLLQEDTVHPEQLPHEPPPKTSANAVGSESSAKKSLLHPNYETAGNLRINTPTKEVVSHGSTDAEVISFDTGPWLQVLPFTPTSADKREGFPSVFFHFSFFSFFVLTFFIFLLFLFFRFFLLFLLSCVFRVFFSFFHVFFFFVFFSFFFFLFHFFIFSNSPSRVLPKTSFLLHKS